MNEEMQDLKQKMNVLQQSHCDTRNLVADNYKILRDQLDMIEKKIFMLNEMSFKFDAIRNKVTEHHIENNKRMDSVYDTLALHQQQIKNHTWDKYMAELQKIDERIEKLESHYYSDGDLSAIHGQLDNIHNNDKHRDFEIDSLQKRIEKLEQPANLIDYSAHERINKLDSHLSNFMLDTERDLLEHGCAIDRVACEGDEIRARLEKLESTQQCNPEKDDAISLAEAMNYRPYDEPLFTGSIRRVNGSLQSPYPKKNLTFSQAIDKLKYGATIKRKEKHFLLSSACFKNGGQVGWNWEDICAEDWEIVND